MPDTATSPEPERFVLPWAHRGTLAALWTTAGVVSVASSLLLAAAALGAAYSAFGAGVIALTLITGSALVLWLAKTALVVSATVRLQDCLAQRWAAAREAERRRGG